MRRVWLLGLVCAGCAARRWAAEPSDVSDALQARVGVGLRPEDEGPAELPPGVDLEDGLSPEEAVSIALWNNADLAVTLTALGSSRADLVAAGTLSNPTVSGLIPIGPRQWQAAVSLPLEGLWLRPLRVAEARAANDVTRLAVLQTALDLVADVQRGVLQASAARARREPARTLDRLEAARADRIALQVEVGDIPPQLADDALQRHLAALQLADASERDATTTQVDLGRLTGLHDLDQVAMPTLDELVPDAEPPDADALLRLTLAERPEVQAAQRALEQAEASRRLAHLRVLTATLGLHDQGGGTSTSKGLGLTPSLTLPLLDWNQAGIARAEAGLTQARARLYAVQTRLGFDVEAAVAELVDARAALDHLQTVGAPATERNARRIELAVTVGDTSDLELLQARADTARLQLATIDARARLGAAWIALERAVGCAVLRGEEPG
ncbi:MAG: TolC family protein [Alphaproteobacteria bacterium]|nr:TolC family protein [Alphaproteobacteria bacterium]